MLDFGFGLGGRLERGVGGRLRKYAKYVGIVMNCVERFGSLGILRKRSMRRNSDRVACKISRFMFEMCGIVDECVEIGGIRQYFAKQSHPKIGQYERGGRGTGALG